MKYVIYKGANNNVRYQKVMLLDIRNRQVEEDLTEVILQDTETKKLITLGELLEKLRVENETLKKEFETYKEQTDKKIQTLAKAINALKEETREKGII
jgi:hypothetical protein